jgi:hypothetical protein
VAWTPDAENPGIPDWAQGACSLYALWPFANSCRARCPYCLLGDTGPAWPRAWTEAQAVAGWQRIAEQHGPCYVLFGGREPTEELPLLASVLACHYGTIATNCMFSTEEFCTLIPPERCELHPSYHPHLWRDLDEFLARLDYLRGADYRVPTVALVGWPPYLSQWDDWKQHIEAAGLYPNLAIARQCTYQGRRLPDEYTEEELAILRRLVWLEQFTPAARMDRPGGVTCAAGHVAFAVLSDGSIERCSQVRGAMVTQNLFDGNGIALLDGPAPCAEACCQCTNMWGFHL